MLSWEKTQQGNSSQVPTTTEVIPTVDSSVKVDVKAESDPKKFDMSVKGIPAKTTSIEYEITYETQDDGIQGFNSPVELKPGQDTYEKKGFLLGTCSTGGKCTYHKVTSPLKVNIKFVGSLALGGGGTSFQVAGFVAGWLAAGAALYYGGVREGGSATAPGL
jgi:hypothetical protein